MYQLPTVCLACLNTTNILADTVLELIHSHIDWALAKWQDLVCASWICKYLFNLFSPQNLLTWYFEGCFWNWNLLFHTFSDYFYIFCVEWILSEMLSFEMFREIYIDDQHMNQCHYFIKLLSTGGLKAVFECSQSWVNSHFPLESERFSLVDFDSVCTSGGQEREN